MSIQFEKTDKTCNNIYLIDERLCLSDSFNILNFNFNTLSANTDILMDFSNQFNSLYTYFAQNSADWSLGFSPQNYCLSQEVMVYINLYQIDTFTFSFSGKYEEKCLPVVQPKQICCSGNQCGNLHRGCNLNEGGRHFCINAYSRCATNITTSCSTGSCPSTGSKLLKLLQVSNTYNDTYTARCFKFKYKKESEGDWTLQI